MSKQYETVFIMTPVLSEEQTKETAAKFKKIITGAKNKVVNEENWGLRKLAYPIQKKSTGFYHLIQFEGSGDVIGELELAYKRDERVLRFLTVALDKHAIAYSEKRKNKSKKKETASA